MADFLLESRARERAVEEASRCNRCGYCQSVCPTYLVTGVETEVARGRNHLVRASAEGEVRRYCMTPTQPLTYLLGREMIIAIRRQTESRLGRAFSLKRFHDYLLSFGSIPPQFIPPMQS